MQEQTANALGSKWCSVYLQERASTRCSVYSQERAKRASLTYAEGTHAFAATALERRTLATLSPFDLFGTPASPS